MINNYLNFSTKFDFNSYYVILFSGWKNSIRHNLSLHDLFVREVTNGSKASYWTLRPDLNVRSLTLDNVVRKIKVKLCWFVC